MLQSKSQLHSNCVAKINSRFVGNRCSIEWSESNHIALTTCDGIYVLSPSLEHITGPFLMQLIENQREFKRHELGKLLDLGEVVNNQHKFEIDSTATFLDRSWASILMPKGINRGESSTHNFFRSLSWSPLLTVSNINPTQTLAPEAAASSSASLETQLAARQNFENEKFCLLATITSDFRILIYVQRQHIGWTILCDLSENYDQVWTTNYRLSKENEPEALSTPLTKHDEITDCLHQVSFRSLVWFSAGRENYYLLASTRRNTIVVWRLSSLSPSLSSSSSSELKFEYFWSFETDIDARQGDEISRMRIYDNLLIVSTVKGSLRVFTLPNCLLQIRLGLNSSSMKSKRGRKPWKKFMQLNPNVNGKLKMDEKNDELSTGSSTSCPSSATKRRGRPPKQMSFITSPTGELIPVSPTKKRQRFNEDGTPIPIRRGRPPKNGISAMPRKAKSLSPSGIPRRRGRPKKTLGQFNMGLPGRQDDSLTVNEGGPESSEAGGDARPRSLQALEFMAGPSKGRGRPRKTPKENEGSNINNSANIINQSNAEPINLAVSGEQVTASSNMLTSPLHALNLVASNTPSRGRGRPRKSLKFEGHENYSDMPSGEQRQQQNHQPPPQQYHQPRNLHQQHSQQHHSQQQQYLQHPHQQQYMQPHQHQQHYLQHQPPQQQYSHQQHQSYQQRQHQPQNQDQYLHHQIQNELPQELRDEDQAQMQAMHEFVDATAPARGRGRPRKSLDSSLAVVKHDEFQGTVVIDPLTGEVIRHKRKYIKKKFKEEPMPKIQPTFYRGRGRPPKSLSMSMDGTRLEQARSVGFDDNFDSLSFNAKKIKLKTKAELKRLSSIIILPNDYIEISDFFLHENSNEPSSASLMATTNLESDSETSISDATSLTNAQQQIVSSGDEKSTTPGVFGPEAISAASAVQARARERQERENYRLEKNSWRLVVAKSTHLLWTTLTMRENFHWTEFNSIDGCDPARPLFRAPTLCLCAANRTNRALLTTLDGASFMIEFSGRNNVPQFKPIKADAVDLTRFVPVGVCGSPRDGDLICLVASLNIMHDARKVLAPTRVVVMPWSGNSIFLLDCIDSITNEQRIIADKTLSRLDVVSKLDYLSSLIPLLTVEHYEELYQKLTRALAESHQPTHHASKLAIEQSGAETESSGTTMQQQQQIASMGLNDEMRMQMQMQMQLEMQMQTHAAQAKTSPEIVQQAKQVKYELCNYMLTKLSKHKFSAFLALNNNVQNNKPERNEES